MAIERIPNPEARADLSPEIGSVRRPSFRLGPLTVVLMGISVAVAIFSKLGANDAVVDQLLIVPVDNDFADVHLLKALHGQYWRLLSPIFLHFGVLHLVFNMLWLKDLGTVIESLSSTRVLLGLVLVAGVFSNVGQDLAAGPYFGGMSGVVYALLGYVWMKAKFDPISGYHLEKQTVIMMIGWFFLCMTGAVGHVANYAHGFGLGVGMIWGFVAAKSRGFASSSAPFRE